MNGGIWLGVWIAALGAGGVCAALAVSLRDASRVKLEELAAIRNSPSAQRRIAAITSDIEGHVAAINLPRVLFNMIAVVAMVMWITALRGETAPKWLEAAIGVAAASFLVWIFGSVIPSAVAKHAAEGTVVSWSPLLRLVYLLTGPLKVFSRFFDEVVRRLAGKTYQDETDAIQDELLSVVEDAQHEGQFDEAEKKMIQAVVSFRQTTVAQIMTPRTEIEAMAVTHDLGQVVAYIRKGRHSRIPVYEGSLDHILGVFYVKDLVRWLAGAPATPAPSSALHTATSNAASTATPNTPPAGARAGRAFDLRTVLRPAIFVPESKTIRELLTELLERRVHIAIVADEYGGTAGLVTFEDIVEEVFGDIQDEYEIPESEYGEVKVDSTTRTAEIDTRAYVSDTNTSLRVLGVEIPESEDYDTVGGYVTVTLGRIPAKGEIIRRDGLMITILDAEPTRVKRVMLAPLKPAAMDDTHPDLPSITDAVSASSSPSSNGR